MPLLALLDQFAPDFPGFCKVGTGHNKRIDFDAKGFLAVTDSVHLLKKLKFDSIFVDEAHHPLPSKMPGSMELYRLSATHKEEPDFRYTMGQAIEDGVLCDYDITVPALTAQHAYVCLADLLLKQVGRFRRVLAYCNSVAEAKRFRMVLRELGLAAWHINARTPMKKRQTAIAEFAGPLTKPVHVLVTVEVLGEGINIPNADTCMFVEPRNSYRSIIQAIGRVLRHHPAKTLAHIVLPAVAIPKSKSASVSPSSFGTEPIEGEEQPNAREVDRLNCQGDELPSSQVEQQARNPHTFGTAEDEVASGLNSPAVISVAAPPGVISRQGDAFHSAIHSNSEQGEKVRSNHHGDFDTSRLKRKLGSSNYAEPEARVSPSATTDRQQDGVQQEQPQTKCGSVKNVRRHQLTQTPHEEVQDQDLERHKPGTRDPTTPGRPGAFENVGSGIYDQGSPSATTDRQQEQLQTICGSIGNGHRHHQTQTPQEEVQNQCLREFSAGTRDQTTPGRPRIVGSEMDEEPAIQKTQATVPTIRQHRFKLKASTRSSEFDQHFGSQLERFLATLMRADHRVVGATAVHRIQVADCTLVDAGASMMEGWTTEIYNRLSVILSGDDHWEIRFRELEAFVDQHGRLPYRRCKSHYERSLNLWLNSQRAAFRERRLVLHRFQKLLSASSLLIRRRAEWWQTRDTDGIFMERCNELREYVQLHHRLPDLAGHRTGSKSQKLAKWMANVRLGKIRLDAGKMKMLQEVHPLVKAELQKSQSAPRLRRSQWEAKFDQLSQFVLATGCLPKSWGKRKAEKSWYYWLRAQCRKILAGCLPADMAQRLRNAHPLIAAQVDESAGVNASA